MQQAYTWQQPAQTGPKRPAYILHRIGNTQFFLCKGKEVWYFNLAKPAGSEWEFHYNFTEEHA